MPDISMCRNRECKVREFCYRYTAKPSDRQSYAVFEPNKEGKCEYFTPTFATPRTAS